jgi:hypothetical protein
VPYGKIRPFLSAGTVAFNQRLFWAAIVPITFNYMLRRQASLSHSTNLDRAPSRLLYQRETPAAKCYWRRRDKQRKLKTGQKFHLEK